MRWRKGIDPLAYDALWIPPPAYTGSNAWVGMSDASEDGELLEEDMSLGLSQQRCIRGWWDESLSISDKSIKSAWKDE